jgi:nucleoside-diphosphate-sugar epimerase
MIRFAEGLTRRERITVHKDSRRGWLHVDDAVRAIARCVDVEGLHVINIGHPEVVETEWLARYMGELIGIDATKYMDLVELPGRMTLEKYPALENQKTLLGFEPTIDIREGVRRVLSQFVTLKGRAAA